MNEFIEYYDYNLSPNEYFICYYLYNRKDEKLIDLLNKFNNIEHSLRQLQNKGFVKYDKNDNLYLTVDGLDIFISNESFIERAFNEFWETFPSTVTKEDGRYRKTRVSKDRCFNLYEINIKTQQQHENLIKALKEELNDRDKNYELQYLPQSIKWLRSKNWKDRVKKYEIKDEEELDYDGEGKNQNIL